MTCSYRQTRTACLARIDGVVPCSLRSHQLRWSGSSVAASPWASIVTLQTLDEYRGAAAATWRGHGKPVVVDEDRYESYRAPEGDQPAWFRRFFWANIVSGAHATYGGIQYVLAASVTSRSSFV